MPIVILWVMVVCGWLGSVLFADVLLVMYCCVGCAWHCRYELCGCVNGASRSSIQVTPDARLN